MWTLWTTSEHLSSSHQTPAMPKKQLGWEECAKRALPIQSGGTDLARFGHAKAIL